LSVRNLTALVLAVDTVVYFLGDYGNGSAFLWTVCIVAECQNGHNWLRLPQRTATLY